MFYLKCFVFGSEFIFASFHVKTELLELTFLSHQLHEHNNKACTYRLTGQHLTSSTLGTVQLIVK